MMDIDGPRHAPSGGDSIYAQVILLHGYGADGNDLISLAPHWAKEFLMLGLYLHMPHSHVKCLHSDVNGLVLGTARLIQY